jgi:hypothetical protein
MAGLRSTTYIGAMAEKLSPAQKVRGEICAKALEQWLAQLAWRDLVALGQWCPKAFEKEKARRIRAICEATADLT